MADVADLAAGSCLLCLLLPDCLHREIKEAFTSLRLRLTRYRELDLVEVVDARHQ